MSTPTSDFPSLTSATLIGAIVAWICLSITMLLAQEAAPSVSFDLVYYEYDAIRDTVGAAVFVMPTTLMVFFLSRKRRRKPAAAMSIIPRDTRQS
ncbi:MAG: hypothetical protein ABI823_05780 [Bryobacteraceae bacterium]